MTYEYHCQACDQYFDVTKSHTHMRDPEDCSHCGGADTKRLFYPRSVELSKTKVKHAEYNPGLGCVVKNERHKDYLMKSKDVVEVGNDWKTGQTMQKDYYESRETKRKRTWDYD